MSSLRAAEHGEILLRIGSGPVRSCGAGTPRARPAVPARSGEVVKVPELNASEKFPPFGPRIRIDWAAGLACAPEKDTFPIARHHDACPPFACA